MSDDKLKDKNDDTDKYVRVTAGQITAGGILLAAVVTWTQLKEVVWTREEGLNNQMRIVKVEKRLKKLMKE